MKKYIKKIIKLTLIPFFVKDYFEFKKLDQAKRFSYSLADANPQIFDKTAGTHFDRHYVYHPAWAIRKVLEYAPAEHVDISSILSFSATLSALIKVKFYDYRPADISLSNLSSGQADLLSLPFANDSIQSLSCMHTVEHVGLGRYGDKISPDGDLLAMQELQRVLKPGGRLLFVVPVGQPTIEYNAHRIYAYEQIVSAFSGLKLLEFTLIPERQGNLIVNATADQVAKERYACGCFMFEKSI